MRISALLIVLFTLGPSASWGGQTRLLAVIDRFQPDVGDGCDKGWQTLKAMLLKASEGHREEFNIYEWPNEVMPTPGDILNHYRGAEFQADDVLWFYYCGHGGFDAERGHFLQTSQGDLLRSELRAVMEARGTRGVVLTTDACSTPGTFVNIGPIGSAGAPPIEIDHWTMLKGLFDGTSGTVDITAASGTSRAFLDPTFGANFTSAMTSVLSSKLQDNDGNVDGKLDWTEVFGRVRTQTRWLFRAMLRRVAQEATASNLNPEDTDQIPFAYALGRREVAAPASVKVGYLFQDPFQMIGNEQGIINTIQTEFAPGLEGHTILVWLTYWDAQNNQIMLNEHPSYKPYVSRHLDKHFLETTRNNPWEIFVPEPQLINLFQNNTPPAWVRLIIKDQSHNPETILYDRMYPMVKLVNPLGPRTD